MITEQRPLRGKKAASAERLRKFHELAIEHLPAESLDILTFHAAAYLDVALGTHRYTDELAELVRAKKNSLLYVLDRRR
jgi:hypothetical protein